MENTNQKPLECKAKGCGMSFTSEIHLFIHEKQHEIQLNLNLENKSVDQTPTPTRLIENPEEIGLFDDLEYLNPFDVIFQRAVESNEIDYHQHTLTDDDETYNIASANNYLITNEEFLHTPQVFPNIGSTITTITTDSCQQEDFPILKQDVLLSETTLLDYEKTCDNSAIKSAKITNVEESINSKKRELIDNDLAKQKLPELAPKINSQNEIATNPIILGNTFSIIQTQKITMEPLEAANSPSDPLSLSNIVRLGNGTQLSQTQLQPVITVKEKLKNLLNNGNSTTTTKAPQLSQKTKINENKYYRRQTNILSKNPDNGNDTAKKKKDKLTLESRKKASYRYRQRVKKNVNELKDQYHELKATIEILTAANAKLTASNAKLTTENTILKTENAMLTSSYVELTSVNTELTSVNTELTAENKILKASKKELELSLSQYENCDNIILLSALEKEGGGEESLSNISSQNFIESVTQPASVEFLSVSNMAVQPNQHPSQVFDNVPNNMAIQQNQHPSQ